MAEEDGKPSFSDKNVERSSRFSTGKPSSPMSNQKITPHYQMASTGSCHDLCKYGLKHDYEEKEKRPWKMKKFMLSLSGKHNYVRIVAPTELKKSPLPRSLSCPYNISCLSQNETSSDAISSPRPRKSIKGEIMKPCILIEVSSKQDPSSDRRVPKNSSPPLHSPRVKSGSSSSLARPQPVKSRLSSSMEIVGSIKETAAISKEALKSSKIIRSKQTLPIQTSDGPNGINKRRDDDVLTRKNMASVSSSSKKRLASPGSSLSSRTSIGRKFVGSLKLVSSLKGQNRMLKKEIRKTSGEHVPEKTLHVVEIETKPKFSESTEVKEDIIPPLPLKSNLSLVLPSLQVISLSSHEEVGEVEKEVVVDENDVHMEDEIKLVAEEEEEEHTDEHEVEQEEEKEDEEQQLEEEEMEEGDDDDYEEEENVHESDGDESIIDNKTINMDDMKAVERNMRKPLRKRDAISDSGDIVQVFRRGKVLDINSENETPRRLRFRQARTREENHGSKNQISRRSFNRRHSSTSKANSNNTSDQNIVLRHQDLQEKKDDQGLLLNNVIGETASRLVESRKSKVKALVGAFETVISQHDRKPSAQLAA